MEEKQIIIIIDNKYTVTIHILNFAYFSVYLLKCNTILVFCDTGEHSLCSAFGAELMYSPFVHNLLYVYTFDENLKAKNTVPL